ncbi:hypothetical protein B6D22_09265 [Gilliamella apicola]|uniref:hypothetical protein n=2 Tax=Gilliamella apicola TaxID=1196095 RepID=UPI000A34DDC9|nr:hypothetical protein [Gilliamella apicola]OTQ21617.1 hypothetical protein B6D22_09265 [Gilliamella apicola]
MSKIEIMNIKMNNIDDDDVNVKYISGSEDYLIPLVFPDYKIHVELRNSYTEWLKEYSPEFLNKYIGEDGVKVPYLGHAGVLLINGQSGITKYYEYGRYPPGVLGRTRNVPIKDVVITPKKMITITSLKKLLRQLSEISGQKGRIEGGILRSDEIYNKAVEYCKKKIEENDDSERKPYSMYDNSCVTFVQELTLHLGFKLPAIVSNTTVERYLTSKIPTLYMHQFQSIITVRDLFYYYETDKLEVNF